MGSYVPSTEAERREMLKAIGLTDYRELYRDVPEKMYLDEPLNIPEGMSELVSATPYPQWRPRIRYSRPFSGARAHMTTTFPA